MPPDAASDRLPRWARAADALTVLLSLAALVIALTGGERVALLGVSLSLTSWLRPAVWALLITALRHKLVPRPSLYDLLLARRTPPRHETLAAVLPALVVPRVAVLLVGLVAVSVFGFPEPEATSTVAASEPGNLLHRWDTGWYLSIVRNGYRPSSEFFRQQNIAFFPLYPFAVRMVGEVVGRQFLLAGFLVSTAAFAGALVYLFRLGQQVCRTDAAPRLALALLAVYPFAIFFSVVYTESLFLLCAAGAFYHALRRQHLAAAGWAVAAGLTRPNGVLLAVPLAVVVAVRAWPALSRRHAWMAGPFGPSPGEARRPALAELLMVAAPAIGLGIYATYIWRLTGDPLAWMRVQAGWGRGFDPLQALLPDPLLRLGLLRALRLSTFDTLNTLAGFFALVLAWPVARSYGLAFGLFVALNVLVPMLAGGPVSLGRFSSVLFPVFMYLADAVPDRHRSYWVAGFAMGQALVASMFFTWRPLF